MSKMKPAVDLTKQRLKNAFRRLSIIVQDENELIRLLTEIEQSMVRNIRLDGKRDYRAFRAELVYTGLRSIEHSKVDPS